jgi:hypothetical protein
LPSAGIFFKLKIGVSVRIERQRRRYFFQRHFSEGP